MGIHFWFQYRCFLVEVEAVWLGADLWLILPEHVGLEGFTEAEHVEEMPSSSIRLLWTLFREEGREETVEEETL